MKGWIGYFRYANMQGKLQELDVWIRGRFRYCTWKHWKKYIRGNLNSFYQQSINLSLLNRRIRGPYVRWCERFTVRPLLLAVYSIRLRGFKEMSIQSFY
ncbi:MAG: group II intron maturase-specific domain-containing protein [Thiohalospira sp.]